MVRISVEVLLNGLLSNQAERLVGFGGRLTDKRDIVSKQLTVFCT